MAINSWLVHLADFTFVGGGYFTVPVPQIGTAPNLTPDPAYAVVTMPSEIMPDPLNERYDPNSATLRRAATPAELAAAFATLQATQAAQAANNPVALAVQNMLNAQFPKTTKRLVSMGTFIGCLLPAEYAGMQAAINGNDATLVYAFSILKARNVVDLDDPLLAQLFTYLVTKAYLTSARVTALQAALVLAIGT